MAKETLKTVCDGVTSNKNNSTVKFVIEAKEKSANPGERLATVIVQVNYNDSQSATKYKVGQSYSLTIE